MADAVERERMFSKISLSQAREVRDSKEPGAVLAARFGVSEGLVSMIRNGKARKGLSATPR